MSRMFTHYDLFSKTIVDDLQMRRETAVTALTLPSMVEDGWF